MKIVIYLDILLLVNFLAGYLLLCAVGRLTDSEASAFRLLAGAAVAAASSLLILLPALPTAVQLLSKAVCAAAIVGAAFPWRGARMFGRRVMWYFLLNLIGAGACLLAALRYGMPGLRVNNLAVYLNLPPLLLLGCVLAVYVTVRVLLFLFGPPRQAEIWQLTAPLEGGSLCLPLLHDTGFFLKDPYSGAPVALVELAACSRDLPEELRRCFSDWFCKEQPPQPPPGWPVRILECRTASGRRLLPALAVKGATLERQGQRIALPELTLAFSPETSMGGRFCGLFGTDLLTAAVQKKGVVERWSSVG